MGALAIDGGADGVVENFAFGHIEVVGDGGRFFDEPGPIFAVEFELLVESARVDAGVEGVVALGKLGGEANAEFGVGASKFIHKCIIT